MRLAFNRPHDVKGGVNRKLKIGVIGAGVFGTYHASKCLAHPQIDLIGIYDHTYHRANKIAAQHKTQSFSAFEDMLSHVDAVVIASPAQSHGDLAIKALEAGVHCLIEKPIAATLSDAARIAELAKTKNLIVQVGHQERFIMQAIGVDKIAERPTVTTAFRMNPYSPRGTDVSVTLDLMIHDLDLLTFLTQERPSKILGTTVKIRTDSSDASLAFIEFPSGCRARLHASRVEDDYRRTMDITYPSGTVSIDFNAKTLTHNTPFDLNADFAQTPIAKDSLGAATNAFVDAILNDKPVPITAQDGYKALEMALIIDRGIPWENVE